jgi:Immunity protein Imm1
MPFELVYGPAGGAENPLVERTAVSSTEELERELDRLERRGREGDPFIVELVEPSAGTLGIGVGRDESVASFNRADGEPPYYVSAGNGDGAEELVFYYQGTWSGFGPESAVPAARARAAMASFFATGELPDDIAWTET